MRTTAGRWLRSAGSSAPGGWAILMCPVDCAPDDDARRLLAVVTPEDRHRVFGQSDHVRLYGRDYLDRLAAAGFAVRAERYVETCDSSSVARFGLLRDDDAFGEEDVFFCVKSGDEGRVAPIAALLDPGGWRGMRRRRRP